MAVKGRGNIGEGVNLFKQRDEKGEELRYWGSKHNESKCRNRRNYFYEGRGKSSKGVLKGGWGREGG